MPEAPLAEPVATGAPAPGTATASIAAIGTALPKRVVGTEEIAGRLGIDPSWIVQRTGVRARRRATDGESLTELAAEASRSALAAAGVEAAQLDLVLVATLTQDGLLPNAAPLVADAIGARGAFACDLGAACTGFLSGLALAAAQIESGRARHALVVGADLLSRITDHDDRKTSGLFGDGAGAAVLGSGGDGSVDRLDPALRRTAVAVHRRLPRGAADPDARPGHVPGRGRRAQRDHRGGARGRGARRERDRPVRLPPGQRADHARGRRAAGPAARARRRLHRAPRKHLGGDPAPGAGRGGPRRDAEARRPRAARRVRRRLRLGRRPDPLGGGGRPDERFRPDPRRLRARDRRLARHRRRRGAAAGRGRLARRAPLPLRRGRGPSGREVDRGGRRPGPRAGRRRLRPGGSGARLRRDRGRLGRRRGPRQQRRDHAPTGSRPGWPTRAGRG